ncbi:MAG: response regulator [Aestuariibacter sp.]
MQKILIVEDNPEIAQHVERFLIANDFATHHIVQGNEVIPYVQDYQPDLIIMDLMLPGKDGVECCAEIRDFSNVPIIMLTGKAEEIDRLIGLKAGADDYMAKPFSAPELVMRVKAILRRTHDHVYFSIFSIDEEKQRISYKGEDVPLTTLEFKLYHLLFKNPERIYSRQQIIDLVYPYERDISDRTIDSHVKNIRKKLKLAGIRENIVESVYGAGYRFRLPH